jgi:dTDP-4-dehydrorhamnose 3,5-epimerase
MIKNIEMVDTITLIAPKRFTDHRGVYIELFNDLQIIEMVQTPPWVTNSSQPCGWELPRFVQDDISISNKHVLRGFHGDKITWKLISCLYGEIVVGVVNFIEGDKDYLKSYTFTIDTKENFKLLLIPPNHGLAHLVRSDTAIFWYKQSTYYSGADNQFTLKWNDPKIHINWPILNPILSDRDANAPLL